MALRQAQTTVDKLKEILDREKAKRVAKEVIDKLKGGLK